MAAAMGEIEDKLAELRQTFRSGITKSVAWRKNQLRALIELLQDNEDKIFKALHQDLGKHPVETYRDEIGLIKKSAKYALSCLDKWMAPKKRRLPLLFFPASGEVVSEPFGVVLICSAWNFPINLALEPLIGAIAAGNTVMLKPSELAVECASFLAETIPLYLDCKAIKVTNGGVDVCEQLLQQKWNKIFFTGSPRVGSIVMSAAAKHLTPVTLELGGKCPAILDTLSSPLDIKVTVKRIIGGKFASCNGQVCIGVDYILVEKKFAATLIELLKTTIKKFYGENPKDSKSISRIINEYHFERLRKLLEDPLVADAIVHGGLLDKENLFIEPTILLDPPLDAEIMTEEIFGPILPIITLNNIQESIEFINSRPKPLVIYAFTKDETFKKQIVSGTSSGSLIFNDTLVQQLCDVLPFGGVGQSGIGRYHGHYSFETFSHEKAIMQRSFFLELEPRYPPWNDFKMKFLRLAYDFDYFNLLLLLLGLKR
ncbi:Aldehyde dehydrogenase family 3 member F1 [Citrus sinensis]|uniref:Aldehyde dehydrogenase family 3 member F1 n=2 Tax=Citrus sinensis TaxID=2711 RepID=A0ACB8J118_CITSI|nr:Aldehyde dehydrogenase family 3 member F1 [Citrus sinensis]